MPYIAECVVGTLAAIGLICILKTVYDIIIKGYYSAEGRAELFLYGHGKQPSGHRLLCAADQARRELFPGLVVTFVDLDEGESRQTEAARALAARCGITYIKQG